MWFRRKPPEINAVPILTGQPFSPNHWAVGGVNAESPKVGDIVIYVTTDSWSTMFLRDERYRVVKVRGLHPASFVGLKSDGSRETFQIHNLRRHAEVPRFWFMLV